jgi:hypothetical protein
MKKLDRLGWAEGLALSACGVRVNVPGVLARVLPLLPPGWKKSQNVVVQRLYSLVAAEGLERAGMRRLHVLYADGARWHGAPSWIRFWKHLKLTFTCTPRKRHRI